MRFLIVSVFTIVLAATVAAQRADVGGAATPSKLTSVLADLAQSVAQESGPAPAPGAAATTALLADKLPRSVQDAIESRRLRLDANNGVQVYILMSAVTDDTVRQLTDAGVTIEITDAARRRVQARVPIGRLQAVAQLPIVDAI